MMCINKDTRASAKKKKHARNAYRPPIKYNKLVKYVPEWLRGINHEKFQSCWLFAGFFFSYFLHYWCIHTIFDLYLLYTHNCWYYCSACATNIFPTLDKYVWRGRVPLCGMLSGWQCRIVSVFVWKKNTAMQCKYRYHYDCNQHLYSVVRHQILPG